MKSLNKYIILIAMIFSLSAQAHEGFADNSTNPAPKLLLESAIASLAAVKQVSSEDIINGYQIEWTFKIEYNDDQPIIFLFSNEQESCLLDLGSNSFITNSVVCH